MHISCYLSAVVAIVFVSFDAVTAANGADQENLVSEKSTIPGNGGVKRLLRTSKTVEEDKKNGVKDEVEDEERMQFTLSKFKNISPESIKVVAADVSKVRGGYKHIKSENEQLLKLVAAHRWTPDDIEMKLSTFSSQFDLTPEEAQIFAKVYRKFWDARKAE
ncbi:RxLR effector protein [Phytophthora megakarya]|uniref:RxLR effector protein n=1 Tax=Phytophthora megakarya TaxID=4795 RepID=A0A225WIT0_9STRA|nr:RxLR effector protein [Phytophthora megakarya]